MKPDFVGLGNHAGRKTVIFLEKMIDVNEHVQRVIDLRVVRETIVFEKLATVGVMD